LPGNDHLSRLGHYFFQRLVIFITRFNCAIHVIVFLKYISFLEAVNEYLRKPQLWTLQLIGGYNPEIDNSNVHHKFKFVFNTKFPFTYWFPSTFLQLPFSGWKCVCNSRFKLQVSNTPQILLNFI
jgi:hypothetical protein